MCFYKYEKKYYKDFVNVSKVAFRNVVMSHNLKEEDYRFEFKKVKDKYMVFVINKTNSSRKYVTTIEVLTTED